MVSVQGPARHDAVRSASASRIGDPSGSFGACFKIGDHIRSLLGLPKAGEAHVGAWHVPARVLEIGVERLWRPDHSAVPIGLRVSEVGYGPRASADDVMKRWPHAVTPLGKGVAGFATCEHGFAPTGVAWQSHSRQVGLSGRPSLGNVRR